MKYADDHFLFPLVHEPRSRWERAGIGEAAQRRFDRAAGLLVALFVAGWAYSIVLVERGEASTSGESVARLSDRLTRSPFSERAAPDAAFVADELAGQLAAQSTEFRGYSGEVNVVVQAPGETAALPAIPDSLREGASVELQAAPGTSGTAAGGGPAAPGIWNVMLRVRDAIRPVPDLSVISLTPLTAKRGGRIGGYLVGSWPYEGGGAPKQIYDPPKGLVQVTPQNRNLRVSEHFVLGDFLTKGQSNVWPKYVAISPRLLDKLELTIKELEARGHPVDDVFVVSGFRTPSYNAGGGNPAGRGKLSRHMYGDAADIAIDNDHNGLMDDLNGDGRVDVADARVIAAAAEAVERKYPSLIGGIGIYRPTGGHRGMVHIDTRGYRARW